MPRPCRLDARSRSIRLTDLPCFAGGSASPRSKPRRPSSTLGGPHAVLDEQYRGRITKICLADRLERSQTNEAS